MSNSDNSFQTIGQQAEALFTDRGSKFLSFAFPIENIEAFKLALNQLKKAHPKANHFCYAYRLGLNKTVFRVADDGEPSGSAGKPILGQIDSFEITNVAIVVVRYFGGTLLGVPGLINAYKTTAALALQITPIITKPIEVLYSVQCNYTQVNDVMTVCKKFGARVLGNEQLLFCQLSIACPKEVHMQFFNALKDQKEITIVEDKN
jgi:uncharacterized YigZ family protein